MIWIIEDGKRVEGGLHPFYRPEDLHAGMRVRVWKSNRRLAPAVIERVHQCWYEYKPLGFKDPNGSQGQQEMGYDGEWGRFVPTHRMWTLTDDDQPVSEGCRSDHKERPRLCIHVRYRNNAREVVGLCYVRPPDVLQELADA